MKRELIRLIKSKSLLIFLLILIVGVFIFSTVYALNGEGKTDINYPRYDSFEEIPEIIKTIEQEIIDAESDPYKTTADIAGMKDKIRVYTYLQENKIKYDVFITHTTEPVFQMYIADRIDFSISFSLFALIFTIIFSMILSVSVFNADFNSGIYKQLYALGIPRKKIAGQKLGAYFVSVGAVLAIVSLILALTSLLYKVNYGQMLIADSQNVYMLNTHLFIFEVYLTLIGMTLFLSMLFGAVSMLIKNIFAALGVCGAAAIGYMLLVNYSGSGVFASMLSEPSSYFNASLSLGAYIPIYLAKYVIAIGILLLAKYIFLKRDF